MRRIVVMGVLCAFVVACDSPNISAIGEGQSAIKMSMAEEHSTSLLARAIALAMQNDELRHQLRDSWRDSRVSTDHKLVFSDLLSTNLGSRLLDEMARSSGSTRADILALVKELPEFDFYLPIRTHRESWAGTNDILVTVTLDQNADQVTAYSTKGEAFQVAGKDAAAGAPLVVLHPAEPKYPMVGNQRYSTGDRIQLPLEQAYPKTSSVEASAVAGSVFHLARLLTTGVYVDYFDTWRDDGWLGGDLEMEFRSYGYENGPSTGYFLPSPNCSKGIGTGNFPDQPPQSGTNTLVSPDASTIYGCGQGQWPVGYAIWAWEMDGGLNNDDDFGMRFTDSGGLPKGLSIGTSISYHLFYSSPGNTSGTKSLELGLIIK